MGILIDQLVRTESVEVAEQPEKLLARVMQFVTQDSAYHSAASHGGSVTARAGSRIGFTLWGFAGPGRKMIPILLTVTATPIATGSHVTLELSSAHRPGLHRPKALDAAYDSAFDALLPRLRSALAA